MKLKKTFYIFFIILAISLALVGKNILGKSNEPKSKYEILVDAEYCKLYVFKNSELVKEYPCAVGTYNTPTPFGDWTIVNKGMWGEGFGGRWLGFNVPWGKYGIHGTDKPSSVGGHTSHGCIRMYNKDVEELYKYIPIGTKVVQRSYFGLLEKDYRSIKVGDRNAWVFEVQKRLLVMKFYTGRLDGIFSSQLLVALNKFQKQNNLPVTKTVSKREYNKLGIYLMD